MEIDVDRIGHKVSTPASQPTTDTVGVAPAAALTSTGTAASTTTNNGQALQQGSQTQTPAAASSNDTKQTAGTEPYQPARPFNKGMNRPGTRHLVNRRRR